MICTQNHQKNGECVRSDCAPIGKILFRTTAEEGITKRFAWKESFQWLKILGGLIIVFELGWIIYLLSGKR
jgi:hypothetical protein